MPIDWNTAVIGPLMSVFGEAIIYTPKAGSAFPITAVFDEAYREVSPADGIPVTTEMPVLGIQVSQFPAGYDPDQAQGDTLTVTRTGELFTVREGRKDGHGSAKLILSYTGT